MKAYDRLNAASNGHDAHVPISLSTLTGLLDNACPDPEAVVAFYESYLKKFPKGLATPTEAELESVALLRKVCDQVETAEATDTDFKLNNVEGLCNWLNANQQGD